MKLRDVITMALTGLGTHWVRAAACALGLAAGVAATLLLVAAVRADARTSHATVEGLSPDLVIVYPGGPASSGVQVNLGNGSSLTSDDVTALSNQGYVPDAVQAAPTAATRSTANAMPRQWGTDVVGTTSAFLGTRGYSIAEGSFFTTASVNASSPVIVLGQTAANELFPGVDALGQVVRINNNPFTVIGVLAPRGYSGTYNQDDVILTPISTAWVYVLPSGAPHIQQVVLLARAGAADRVKAEVTQTLLQRHHITNPVNADFQVRTQHDVVATSERVGAVLNWTLAAVAAVALVTGTTAIMILMLFRVSERRQQIAASRAMGAARSDILTVILAETLLVAGIAGASGIAMGVAATRLAAKLLTDLPAPVVTITPVAAAAAVALGAGVVAGIYPAVRAANIRAGEVFRTV